MTTTAWHVKRAAQCLHGGGIIAYPTEAVWGLGCDPLNSTAFLYLLALKQRPPDKGVVLIAADYAQLIPYVGNLDAILQTRVANTWPGPVTWLLPTRRETPFWLCGHHDSLAVRVTAHPIAAALCRQYGGAIVSTSANLSGRRPVRNLIILRQRFGDQLDYILPGMVGPLQRPTEIRDARDGSIVRAG